MAQEKKQEVLAFHNAPSFYVGYMENWLAQQKKSGASPVEMAIVEDITKLVKLGVGVLSPVQAEPADKKS